LTLFPYTTLFRSLADVQAGAVSVAAALRDYGVAVELESGRAVRVRGG
jgi:hypothetical protein